MAEYFAGGYQARIPADDYDEFAAVPGCTEAALEQAVHDAVENGAVWLVAGPASVWREPIPHGALDSSAELRPPPKAVAAQELTEEALPGAWQDGKTNAAALSQAVSVGRGYTVPWPLMVQAIKDSVSGRWLALAQGSDPVGGGWDRAGSVLLERPSQLGSPQRAPASDGLFPPTRPALPPSPWTSARYRTWPRRPRTCCPPAPRPTCASAFAWKPRANWTPPSVPLWTSCWTRWRTVSR